MIVSEAARRASDTFVVIDREHLVTTPFDGDAADMIVLARTGDRLDADALHAIKLRLRRVPRVDKTIRFHTFGLERAEMDQPTGREHVTRAARSRSSGTSTTWCRPRESLASPLPATTHLQT